MKKEQSKQKHYYDEKAKECTLEVEVGDEVLIKIPIEQSKLKLEWEGSYRITNKVSSVETPGKKKAKECIMLIFKEMKCGCHK